MAKLAPRTMWMGAAAILLVAVVVLWLWKRKDTGTGAVGSSNNANKPSLLERRFPTAQTVDSVAYISIQERRLPCGRILRKTVEARDGAWAKTVTLMSPEGRILKSTTRTIEPETCALIQKGQFVPNLWSDCTVSLD